MKNVKISDITLRECVRTRSLSFKERVEIYRAFREKGLTFKSVL